MKIYAKVPIALAAIPAAGVCGAFTARIINIIAAGSTPDIWKQPSELAQGLGAIAAIIAAIVGAIWIADSLMDRPKQS